MKSFKKYLPYGILLALIVMQFFPIDKTNPTAAADLDYIQSLNPPENISKLLKAACYDCHSNETVYPWYTSIAPISWWVQGHYEAGREELNFSTWKSYSKDKQEHLAEECAEKVIEKEMPLLPYILVHWDAKISEEERKALNDWFIN